MDIFGPLAVRSYGGNRYTLVIVDDYSRYTWTRFLKDKTEAFDQFEIFSKKIQNQLGCTIVSIRTDHGREFDNEVQFGEFCNANGITHNFSAPRTPQSNGVVERKNRTLQEMSRTMLNEQSLPQKFWCNAVDTSTYILNQILIRAILGKTPYELLRGRKPTLDYFRVFGSKYFILNTKDYLTKFDPKSYEGVFLGYSQNSKAYIILNKHTRKIKESLNVTFDETPPPSKTSPLVDDDLDEEEAIRETKKKNLENVVEDETLEIDEIVNIKESRNHPLENVIGNLNQRTLRSQAQNQSNFFCFISTIEPKNVNEALGDESWIVAMQEELNQFIANDVWELVPQPKNMTIIGTKWVFRNKLTEQVTMPRKSSEDYKNTRHYIPKISHEFRTPIKEKLRNLEERYIHEGRVVFDNFADLNYVRSLFHFVEFECLLEINEQICPRFILEFYSQYQINYSDEGQMFVEFVIQNQLFSYSLEDFAQILNIPCEGACVFTDRWRLDELAYGIPSDGPYHTNPLFIDDIISSIRINREGQVRRICHEEEIDVLEYQILTHEIVSTLKPLEEIIRENKFNLAYYMAKQMEWVTKQARSILPYGMLLTRLFKFIMNEYPYLYNESYVLYDCVMNSLAAQLERKTRKDRGTRRGRHSTSSSTFDQPSSSHLNDDDDDGNDEGTSRASTPSPIRYVNLLTNEVPQVFQNPPNIDPNLEPLYTRQTEIINRQVQIQDEHRGGVRSIGKSLRKLWRNMKNPSNPQPLQSHPSLDITLSLSPFENLEPPSLPSPPQPQPPIMGHPPFYNYHDYHGSTCICCSPNRNLFLTLRDEMNIMFAHLEYLLTTVLPPKTAEETLARERERKARTTLLMALPEDHLARFHNISDVKEMWDAIKTRFGGNAWNTGNKEKDTGEDLMSANDKFGLGYGDYRYDGILSYEMKFYKVSVETSMNLCLNPAVNEPKVVSQPKVWSDAPIIEEYESDSEDEHVSLPTEEQETPSFA
ncbi:retrovirus-related pol polyprotein from transposon TNT 1-94 [Tanacetum coccineum]